MVRNAGIRVLKQPTWPGFDLTQRDAECLNAKPYPPRRRIDQQKKEEPPIGDLVVAL